MISIDTKIAGKKTYLCRYDGIADVLNSPMTEENAAGLQHTEDSQARSSSWYGISKNLSECNELFSDGWTDGVKTLSKKSNEFALEAPLSESVVSRPRQVYSDEGETLDPQAALSGDWEHAWHGMERRQISDLKTRVHLIIDIGGHAGTSAKELQWPGILGAVLAARALENGYDVKITAVSTATSPFYETKVNAVNLITLKHYDAPMSLANLAPLMLPAMFRAVGFKAFYNSKHHCTSSLGQRWSFTEEMARQIMGADMDDGTPIFIHGVRSHSQAVKEYKRLIKQINGGAS